VPKSIALVTPWPPQSSGIADYAYDLAMSMVGPCSDVHIVTTERSPASLAGVCFHHADEIATGELDLSVFDGILVQLGNHPRFHGYMLNIINNFRCTVELHDILLHHCIMGEGGVSSGSEEYFYWLTQAYGTRVAGQFRHFLAHNRDILQCPIAAKYPCSDAIAANAERVIVHSQHGKAILTAAGHGAKVEVVNLCHRHRDIRRSVPPTTDPIRIGVFGGVQRNRQVSVILAVLGKINLAFQNWSLDLVGSVDDDCSPLLEVPQSLGIQNNVKFHGRLPTEQLEEVMQQCGIVISLRNPTMGETSAVVVRAMQMGTAIIVSNVGWYRELPPSVLKVDNLHIQDELERALGTLLSDQSLRQRLAKKTAAYAAQRFDLRNAADDILFWTLYGPAVV
jgi:glycosyltransferase involved in cell wall biosynthesis